jgi:endonuclease III-like uncharacterized protein
MNGMLKIYDTFLDVYGQRHWWPAKTPFEMMVGAILTQNTTWLNVEKAIRILVSTYPQSLLLRQAMMNWLK